MTIRYINLLFAYLLSTSVVCLVIREAQEDRVIKFGAEVRSCIWRLCYFCVVRYHLSSPLYCVNDQHDFKGCGENQRVPLHDKT